MIDRNAALCAHWKGNAWKAKKITVRFLEISHLSAVLYSSSTFLFYQLHQLVHLAIIQRKRWSVCRDGACVVRQECDLTSYPHGTKAFRRENCDSWSVSLVGYHVLVPGSRNREVLTFKPLYDSRACCWSSGMASYVVIVVAAAAIEV